MANNLSIPFFFSTSSFIIFFLLHLVMPHRNMCFKQICKSGEPEIQFPFRLKQFQPDERCVYPGFDLSCNGQNRTTVSIPPLGEFIVISISYVPRIIWLQDTSGCLPKRLQYLNTSGSNWSVQQYREFTFFKCPMESRASDIFQLMPCLDGHKYYVVVVAADDIWGNRSVLSRDFQCNYSHDISIPTIDGDFSSSTSYFGLTWNEPSNCTGCERLGQSCGFKGKKGLETGCIPNPGVENAKSFTTGQLIILGITGPCFVCSMCWIACKSRARRLAQEAQTNPSSAPRLTQAPVAISGMDTPMIESYPKTRVGEAGGLIPRDNICSICLSEYRSKDVLRTLPECKHSFHAHCIDPWLKKNASCPLCRNGQGSAKSTISTREDTSQADHTVGNQHVTQQVD